MSSGVEEATTTPWVPARPGGVGALTSWTTSDGGPRLASSGSDGTIQVWDPEQGVAVGAPLVYVGGSAACPPPSGAAKSTPPPTTAVSRRSMEAEPLEGPSAGVWTLATWEWSGGRLLVSADEDGVIRRWNPDTGASLGPPLAAHTGWIRDVTLWDAPDGSPRLASAGVDGFVRIWDPVGGTAIGAPLVSQRSGLAALASWPADGGTRLAIAGDDGLISVWDPETRQRIGDRELDHTTGLWALAAWTLADGTPRLASAGNDGTIRIWHPGTGTLVTEPLRGHTGWVPVLATLPADGTTRLVSASTDGTIRVWDPETGRMVGAPLRIDAGNIPALAVWIAADGCRRLAFVGDNGAIHSCDADTGAPVEATLLGHTAGLWALTSWAAPDGQRLAASGDDSVIRMWHADTGRAVGEPLAGHTAAVWALVAWVGDDGTDRLASSGDDGTIRIWRPGATSPAGPVLTGHAGWVPGLATWPRADGRAGLVSAGMDGTIRRWDPETGEPIGAPFTGHDGWVLSLTVWRGRAGVRMASGGVDGTVRIWDPETGEAIGAPLAGHSGWVRTLTTWSGPDGRTLLISGSYDGTVRIWDAESGATIGQPLTDHTGRVGTLVTWTAPDGGARLASAGGDGLIRLWDLDAGTPWGSPLSGHETGIWAMTGWTDARRGTLLASAGQDGTLRLWDPERGRAVRTIEVGPVAMWGIADTPTSRDVIGRQVLANAIADQICRPAGGGGADSLGPTVVGIEGPWGCGKSTLMDLIRQRLPVPPPPPAAPRKPGRHVTVRAVLRQIRRYAESRPGSRPPPDPPKAVVTAWFNPWAHQSGEQVWAGLANEIVEAAGVVLYPTEPQRERYWVARNLGRVDRYALARSLRRRTRSPLLNVAAVAVVAPVAIGIARLNQPVRVLGHAATPVALAIGLAALAILCGVLHTAARRGWGTAVHYLPSEFLSGPITEDLNLGDGEGPPEPATDPLHRARAGALYLHQHSIGGVIDDLAAAGYDLVVFVDDLDRCRPGTTAEVFEAINLFLSSVASRTGLWAHFVVGLDSAVVAASLDTLYAGRHDADGTLHGDDSTPGWAFLRKLVQLPVIVPQVPDTGVERFVDAITQRAAPIPAPAAKRAPAPRPRVAAPRPPAPAPVVAPPKPAPRPPARAPVDTRTWRSMEQHPDLRELVVHRLRAQPFRSIREAKRLLNVWQLYARILEATAPLTEPAAAIAQARELLLVAEIVTRWPVLQRALHRRFGDRRGLQVLAAAAGDDGAWRDAVCQLGIEDHRTATANLRAVLREYDGVAIADLAARLT
jgi:WD40 repeat protein